MPTLNFKKQFVAKILDGTKTQTIRANRKRPFTMSDTLYLKTGSRFKPQSLMTTTCIAVGDIRIEDYEARLSVPITPELGAALTGQDEKDNIFEGAESTIHFDYNTAKDLEKLAKNDGFENWQQMRDWFKSTHGLPFEGQLIEWGNSNG